MNSKIIISELDPSDSISDRFSLSGALTVGDLNRPIVLLNENLLIDHDSIGKSPV
jgi:hypothetical protein